MNKLTENKIRDIVNETVTGANYEYIFPELKESEDERIKQEILHYIKSYAKLREEKIPTEWFEYLEKQGEQKPTDKIDPKFKVGDWITDGEKVWKIGYIEDDMYIEHRGTISAGGVIKNIDKHYHLWTIADAKDGDVLANDHHILILKELVYDWSSNGTPYSVKAYCGIKPNGNFEIGKDNWCFCGTLHVHPATKEQRDLLFQKMKDAGYEWDAQKKELKKMEVPSEESDDERIRKTLIELVRCNERSGYFLLNNIETSLMIAWLEKQVEKESDPRYKYLEDLLTADDIHQMSMNEAMVEEAKSKAVNALSKLGISKLLGLEKQGFNKEQTNLPCFTFDDVLALQCCMDTVKKIQDNELNKLYEKLYDLQSKMYNAHLPEKQSEKKPTEDTKKLDADKVIA